MPGQPVDTFDVPRITLVETGGFAPSEIINSGNPVAISVDFLFKGPWANWLVSQNLPYEVRVSAESIGPGGEFTFPVKTGNTAASQLNYSATVNGTLTISPSTPAGVYKLTALVNFPGSPPAPLAGFIEGPIIQLIP